MEQHSWMPGLKSHCATSYCCGECPVLVSCKGLWDEAGRAAPLRHRAWSLWLPVRGTQGTRGSFSRPSAAPNQQGIKRELLRFAFDRRAGPLPVECQALMMESVQTRLVRPLLTSIPVYLGEEQTIKKPQKTLSCPPAIHHL